MTESGEGLILTPAELAAVTGGAWSHRPDGGRIRRIALNAGAAGAGDLLVTRSREQWRRVGKAGESQALLDDLARRGVAGAIVREASDLDPVVPLLRVADTARALDALARASRDRASAKRLLVTGTEGKTGFKAQLHHVVADQLVVAARLDSNNQSAAIRSTLANLRRHDALAIVEVAVPRLRLGIERSRLVAPHLCVITELGYEHLRRHGTVADLIRAKAAVVDGLQANGWCLAKSDPRYFAALDRSIQARKRVPMAWFGTRPVDDGRLLSATFLPRRGAWAVAADVDGRLVEYVLPVVEQHAPLSSVGVLLAVSRLGLDVERAAARFESYPGTETAGRLFELALPGGGRYRLYDQSQRSYMLGLGDFFCTVKLLQPGTGGRRIAVLGHVYDEKEYGRTVWELMPPPRLRALIDNADIDRLYTVGKREEFERILVDFPRWSGHVAAAEELVGVLAAELRPNDLLAIKGDVTENMSLLPDGLRQRAGAAEQGA